MAGAILGWKGKWEQERGRSSPLLLDHYLPHGQLQPSRSKKSLVHSWQGSSHSDRRTATPRLRPKKCPVKTLIHLLGRASRQRHGSTARCGLCNLARQGWGPSCQNPTSNSLNGGLSVQRCNTNRICAQSPHLEERLTTAEEVQALQLGNRIYRHLLLKYCKRVTQRPKVTTVIKQLLWIWIFFNCFPGEKWMHIIQLNHFLKSLIHCTTPQSQRYVSMRGS